MPFARRRAPGEGNILAFVMKRPLGRSKGIIVFTHKESAVFSSAIEPMSRLMREVRSRFVIGIHYGWHSQVAKPPPWVDFHLAPDSTVEFALPNEVKRIPMNSSHFASAVFRRMAVPKQWDVISVTRPVAFKNTDVLLTSLRSLKRQRPSTRALIICASSQRSSSRSSLGPLEQQYLEAFNHREREDIVFLPFQLRGAPFPFPRRDLAWLYNASRVFTLFSRREGGSKVIKEALLCGLPVVLDRNLEGGGLEFANAQNSRLFAGPEDAATAMLEVLDHYDQFEFDTQALALETSETHTIPKLLTHLERIFHELGLPFEGPVDTEDLAMKLPSHHPGLVVDPGQPGWTSDVRSARAGATLLCQLLQTDEGAPVLSPKERAVLSLRDASLAMSSRLAGARRSAKRVAKRVFKV